MSDLSTSDATITTGCSVANEVAGGQVPAAEIQGICIEVQLALAAQAGIEDRASRGFDGVSDVRIALRASRVRVTRALTQFRSVAARTNAEFGLKARLFQHIREKLGDDDTRVAVLAVALLDEAVILFPSQLFGTGSDPTERRAVIASRVGRRTGILTRPDIAGFLGWSRRSQAGD